jgi:membrane protein DedA with SNARE-associated domain
MNAWLAFAAGTAGSLVGAIFNYYIAVWLGRPLLHRYSKYLLIREESLDRAEAFFRRHGEISMFVGRLVPVIRQLISLPAGLARMRVDLFAFYTALGAGIWCAVLTAIGWFVGKNAGIVTGIDELMDQPEFHRYSVIAGLILLPVLITIVVVYVLRHRRAAGQGSGEQE